ncbi:MAG TPA: glycine zipper 2TM domain-containing protein [Burkholderiaceae bacterium]
MTSPSRSSFSKSLFAVSTLGLLMGTPMAHAQAPIAPDKAQLAHLCKSCAFVSRVHTELRQGEASGVGVVGGAVIGGLLGNRLGGGTGRALTTAGGAVAGGYAGNEIEKNSKKRQVWVVNLVYRDGSRHSREFGQDQQLRAGDVVSMREGRLIRQ